MDHVNNAVYADWLDEAVQGGRWHRGRPGRAAAGPSRIRPGSRAGRRPSTQRCGRTAMPGRAGSGTTTATCSAPGSSRSSTTGAAVHA